ncbi:MAG: carbohydrate kinase family protein [Spirochaetota bacterium]
MNASGERTAEWKRGGEAPGGHGECDVLCAGILVADLFSSPLPEMPPAGGLALVDRVYPSPGGCAANTAVCLRKCGARVALAGKVGRDVLGDYVVRALSEQGVDTAGVCRSASLPTSSTMIIPVHGEDRRYIHAPGANTELGAEDVSRVLAARCRALYLGGFLLQPLLDPESVGGLFAAARARGALTALDVIVPAGSGPEEGCSQGPEESPAPGPAPIPELESVLGPVLPHTDLFLPNRDEAAALTGTPDPCRQAEIFTDLGAGTVAVTMGAEGAVLRSGGQTLRAPVYPVEVVDPSGAGDAFDAGFIWGMLQGWDLERTAAFASALGASACTALGCTGGVLTGPEALAFIERNPLRIDRGS